MIIVSVMHLPCWLSHCN